MHGASTILYILSAILFIGTIHFLMESKRPGVYPPRQLLKKRAIALAGGGVIFLLLGFLFSSIST